jgi:hypothetical protein
VIEWVKKRRSSEDISGTTSQPQHDGSENGQKRHQSCYCSRNALPLEKRRSKRRPVRDCKNESYTFSFGRMGQKSKTGRLDKTLKGQDTFMKPRKECFAHPDSSSSKQNIFTSQEKD